MMSKSGAICLQVVFDRALGFAQIHCLFQVLALIVLLFGTTEGDFQLNQAILEIHLQGNNGAASTLDGPFPFLDFPLVEKEFPRPVGIVVGICHKGIFRDMGMMEDRDALVDAHVGIVYLGHSVADGLDLGSTQDNAGLDCIIDKVIPASAGIAHLLEALTGLFAAHLLGSG